VGAALLTLNLISVTFAIIRRQSPKESTSEEVSEEAGARLRAVGFIALAGVAAEIGVVMLIYLDNAMTELRAERDAAQQPFTHDDLRAAIKAGAVERVRPKMITVAAIMAGLLPIMWSHGTGAEAMQRIALPMIGGIVSSTLLTLVVVPAIYAVVKAS
jgi:Cu(I)/Ag(I) efflux system membrane protein CusA/SilA